MRLQPPQKVSCNKTLILCPSGEPVQPCGGHIIEEHRKAYYEGKGAGDYIQKATQTISLARQRPGGVAIMALVKKT